MAINLPSTSKEVVDRSKTDVQRELATSNPFLRNSFLSAIVTATAKRIFDFYFQLQQVITQLMWSTSTGDFLDLWAGLFIGSRTAATAATGNVIATGTLASSITAGVQLQSSDGLTYTVNSTVAISNTSISVTSLVRVGTTVTATTASDHDLASDVEVTIAGAVETDYNGDFVVTVTGSDTFTYTVTGSPTTPATGSITADYDTASVSVTADDQGADTNQSNGAKLTFITPIAGVDSQATVDFNELAGGTDIETDSDYKERFIDKVQNPVAFFNVANIKAEAKKVSGVTRVFVQPITPSVGQVTVYFVRDNDDDIIPTAPEVTAVDDQLQAIRPAHMKESDFIINAPTAATTNFTFTSISPNTSTMQTAIEASLDAFFRESTEVGVNVESDAYRAAIINTIDQSTGATLSSFTLSAPAGDISVSSGQIATLGTVAF